MRDNEAVDDGANVDPASQDSAMFDKNDSEMYVPNKAMN